MCAGVGEENSDLRWERTSTIISQKKINTEMKSKATNFEYIKMENCWAVPEIRVHKDQLPHVGTRRRIFKNFVANIINFSLPRLTRNPSSSLKLHGRKGAS